MKHKTGTKIFTEKSMAASEARMAIFWITLRFKDRILDNSRFSAKKTLISVSSVTHCGAKELEIEEGNGQFPQLPWQN